MNPVSWIDDDPDRSIEGGGQPLQRLLGEPMDVGKFLRLAAGLTAAVGQLHRRGLIHKDVRPANVLVDSMDQVRLTGFAISSRVARAREMPDPPEGIAGTLPYMAPEQTGRMNRSVDARSDLYSLGVTFYEMLTGSLPFSASDPMEWVHCHIARQPPPPNERVTTVPAPVAAIVSKLLEKNAEHRYQTAAGLEADLQRCLAQWEGLRRITPFALGRHDVSDRLMIPERLYGREAEIATLVKAFERVAAEGTTGIVLISGYAGIGKSSIVNELHKTLLPRRGLFAAGKFDQYKRDVPYATLAQAFQSLVRHLVSSGTEQVAAWRSLLLEAVGANGQLLIDLIPELEEVIGEQPSVPDLPPQEGQHRFQRVLRRFVGTFARPEHPLVLFLDDLQWLDAATLEMLEHLATHPEVHHLLLVAAYRDHEVGASHPLARILPALRGAGREVDEIALASLALHDVSRMVADSLHCDIATAQPLARLIHDNTGGNPFFAIQFFTTLGDDALLQFDPVRQAWTWDLARIRAKGFAENVIDLMASRLGRLSAATQKVLGQLACLGNVARVETLALIHGGTEEQLHHDLWEALTAGLVLQVDGAYRFLHDRVHEAAYALIPGSERAAAHLRIGRMLLANTPPESLDDVIFDIAGHFNRAVSLIVALEERERVIALNLRAGRRARNATAYASARNYLAQAVQLLPADAWTRRYEETFDLYLLLSECEYLVGSFAAADALFDTILRRASSDIDSAKVHSLRMKLYQVAGKYDEALAVALKALRHFGIAFPENDEDISTAIEAQLRELPINLAGRPIGALLDAPVAADPVKRTIIDLLVDTVPGAYIGRPALFPLVALEAVNRSIRDGNTEQSSYAYGVFALMLVSSVGDIDSAFQFSEMALRLNDRFDNARLRGTLLHLHGDHVNFWRRHFATGLPILRQAFAACLEVGDLVYAGFLAFETVWQVIEKGDRLEDVLETSSAYASFAQQSHNFAVYETIRLEQRFVASLQGRCVDPLIFSDDSFDETVCVDAIASAAFGCGIVFRHIMKQMLAVLYGRYPEALLEAAQAEPVLGAAMAMPIEATYHFYHALTLTALYADASAVERAAYRGNLDRILAKLRLWSDHSPENYRNRYSLVFAEVARIEGRDIEAMRAYEEAIRSARDHEFVQNEALASELAGRFHLSLGLEASGRAHLQHARACYAAWGAEGKVRDLESRYPAVATIAQRPRPEPIESAIQKLDVLTVVKASQAVSSETTLPALIERLMTIALQNAGADRGVLIRPQEDGYVVEAVAELDRDVIALGPSPSGRPSAPDALIRHVIRTQKSVILDDASRSTVFADDEYLRQHAPKSVFCLPLVRQSALAGVLYLENTLTSHVFTPDRTALLALLASQLAVSLENTRLYEDLREREARIRRLVDSNIIGIFIWNLSGDIVEANEAFARMVGYTREEVAAGSVRWNDLRPGQWRDDKPGLADIVWSGTMQPREKEFVRKDGGLVPVLIGAAAFDHRREQGVAFVVDLTERKRAEQEVIRSERRYQEVQMELAHANRVATMGQLSTSIAHEVSQPITGVVLNAQTGLRWLAAERPNVEGVREILGRIARDANRAAEVIARSRNLIKKAPPRKESLNINDTIQEVISLTRAEAIKYGVSVRLQLQEAVPVVLADRVQLQQVMLNLMINAVEALQRTHDRSREVAIDTGIAPSGDVVVAVRDSGPGVEPGDLERIFEPFYSTKPSGLGVGLSICRAIIEAHGGRLWASPETARGALFQFTLPALTGARDVPPSSPDRAGTPRSSFASPGLDAP